MYIVVRGDPKGPFDTVIDSVIGYLYNGETQLMEKCRGQPTTPETYFSHLGVVWVGFWRYFLWREVRYDKWEKEPEPSTRWGLVSKVRGVKGKKGDSPSIFFRYNMATRIEAAETVGNFPVDAVLVFTAQVRNPSLAFFFAGGWESQTTAAVQDCFRKYVSNLTVDELREEVQKDRDEKTSNLRDKGLVSKIKALGKGNGKNGLLKLFGIKLIDARFVLFDLIADDPEMTRAVRAVEIATLTANAKAIEGDGERRQREARATGVSAEVKAWGAHVVGGQVVMAEAIKVAKPNVLGGSIIASVDSKR